MNVLLALAVLVIAIIVAKRTLWRHYEPELSAEARQLRWADWTAAGIRFFSWVAGIALVLAAVYFVRSTPHGSWLAVAVGLAAGIALLLISAALAALYGLTADAIDGAGIGILYVACYAMHVRWGLVPLPVALVAMLLVTGAAMFLASRRGSFFIAILGLIGGFAMPALLSFSDAPAELFAYLLVLNGGMSWLAYRMRWPLLIALSVVRTTIYEWTWVMQSLTSSQLWLPALIFAAFAIVAAAPFWYRPWHEYPPRFRQLAAVAVLLPLFFAFYMAANTNYGLQYNVLFGFLLLIAVTLFAIVWRGGPVWLHVAGGIATLLTFFLWFLQWGREWSGPDTWPPSPVPGLILMISIWIALFIALYLVRTTLFAALLFFAFIGLAIRQPGDYVTLIVVMLGILYAVIHTCVRRRNPILGAIAIFLSAAAVMVLNPFSPLYAMNPSHAGNPPPQVWPIFIAFAFLFAALFVVAWLLERPVLAVLAVPFYALMLATVYAPTTVAQLAFAVVPYLLFVAYILVLRPEAKTSLTPYVAVVLASVVFFASVSTTLDRFAGIVPLLVAAILFVLLWRDSGIEPREPRLTLLLTAAVAFFNAALPFILAKPWIAIVMAIEVAALIWLSTRFALRSLVIWSAGLAAVLFLWLTFDAGLFTYVDHAVLYVYVFGFAYAICAVLMFGAAYVTPKEMTRLQVFFSLAGLIESWFLVNIIIANLYHSAGVPLNIDFLSFSAAEDVTYTIAWAVIATVLLFIGLRFDWRGARIGATGLLLTAILKCFLHDLVRRGDYYRVASLLGVAVSLLVVGIVLQRYSGRGDSPAVAA